MGTQMQLLSSLGVSLDMKRSMSIEGWDCYILNYNSKSKDAPIFLVEVGPKNTSDIKKMAKNFDTCVIIATELQEMHIKTMSKSHTIPLESDDEQFRIAGILKSQNIDTAKNELELNAYLDNVIDIIPNMAGDFENRGLFSTHYLRNRIFDDIQIEVDTSTLRKAVNDTKKLVENLGWHTDSIKGVVKMIITQQQNFSIRKNQDVVPSYGAVSELKKYRWVILTNGTKWRLYTSRVSASSTNYFEINLDEASDRILKYLVVIFGYDSYVGEKPKMDHFFDQGKEFATQLEEDLASRIMSQDGVMLSLAKGILNHNMKTVFGDAELDSAKEAALKVIYRVWFVAYAESRNLLPVSDKNYAKMSLRQMRNKLDWHESNSKEQSCWKYLLELFDGIRNGSPKNNLPQYNGNLFKRDEKIDGIKIQNRWLVPAMRDLLERNGDAIDYASLGVRHLGNILENVIEFTIQQARDDIMLLVRGKKIIQVKTSKESNYSYKKNDLYLASKGGIAVRKSTASYYTPDEIVKFLVKQGLEPVLEYRSKLVAKDVKIYQSNPNNSNKARCMDRLLDIQVLDPTMGSGHFLVEALNRLTSWATGILKENPSHPLLEELENDRKTIVDEQEKKNITVDENLLTHDILLKRRIMKRCIFGVDLNNTAVEIAKLSLWLDSFAIGVPLTYMDHHIKSGDSTIGCFLDELAGGENRSLDDWVLADNYSKMLEDIAASPDITISQVHRSEDLDRKYRESISPSMKILDALAASYMDNTILPKKSKMEFIHRFGKYDKNEEKILEDARGKVKRLSEKLKFFHWELEFRDAFTDKRSGFDVILGNPPWDKVKPDDDEFFTPYSPEFRALSPKPKKNKKKDKLLQDSDIKERYVIYQNQIKEKNSFYSTYEKQGAGHKELSKLIFERSIKLLTNSGIISMVLPSQILSSNGSVDIRSEILNRDIISLYVFENRNKIFNIHRMYRFMLLTLRDSVGADEFSAGFYLHNLSSLEDNNNEPDKFVTHSKEKIRQMFPDSLIIPESIGGDTSEILGKMYKYPKLRDCLGDNTTIGQSRGFDKTNDSDLFQEDGRGWPVHEGKTIHQYNHVWSTPKFTVQYRAGLKRENKPKYNKKHIEFYNSYRLVFRDISSPTNMRTVIATILPPKTFHTYTMNTIMIKSDGNLLLDHTYMQKMLYLCGIFNSIPFDFIARQIAQVNIPQIINKLPVAPPPTIVKSQS